MHRMMCNNENIKNDNYTLVVTKNICLPHNKLNSSIHIMMILDLYHFLDGNISNKHLKNEFLTFLKRCFYCIFRGRK